MLRMLHRRLLLLLLLLAAAAAAGLAAGGSAGERDVRRKALAAQSPSGSESVSRTRPRTANETSLCVEACSAQCRLPVLVEPKTVCFRVFSLPSGLPRTSMVNLVSGLVLIGTFIFTLRRVNLQNRRALVGIEKRSDKLLEFDHHVTFLQAASVWAVSWAVYKMFSTDPGTDSSHVYHGISNGLVVAFSVFLELSMALYLFFGDAGKLVLRNIGIAAGSVSVVYFAILVVVISRDSQGHGHQEADRMYPEENLVLLVFSCIAVTFYGALYVYSKTKRNNEFMSSSFRALTRLTRFLTVYYAYFLVANALVYFVDEFGTGLCMWMSARLIYFACFASVLFQTLLVDSKHWRAVMSISLKPLSRAGTEAELLDGWEDVTALADEYNQFYDDDPDNLTVPKQYEQYIIPSRELTFDCTIGAGTSGTVSLYRWVAKSRPVAVKTFTPKMINSETLKEFQAEVSVIKGIRDANLVEFLGVFIAPPHLGIVMEYCEHGNLFDLLHDCRERRVDPRIWQRTTPLKMALEIARGMLALHRDGVVHRDLKSLNVLLDSEYRAKIADFGSAKRIALDDSGTVASSDGTSTLVGTPMWMAPEQFTQRTVQYTTDVYSFGVVLWELLTWQEPFVRDSHATESSRIDDMDAIMDDGDEKKSEHRKHSIDITSAAGASTLQQPLLDSDMALQPIGHTSGTGSQRNNNDSSSSSNNNTISVSNVNQGLRLVVDRELRPPIPRDLPEELKRLLMLCWQPRPDERPSFDNIVLMMTTSMQDIPMSRFPFKV